jgi:hypothetical protein
VRAYSLDDAAASAPPGVVISNAPDPTDLSDSFALPLGVAGTSTTFTGTQMQIAGVPTTASVTAAYAANGDLTLTQNAAWNVIKNATIKATDAAAHGVTIRNFVDVELTSGGGHDTVSIAGMKRGTVSTGDGNDSIAIAGQSNSSTSNLSKVVAGLGDDTITFSGNSYGKATLDGGGGNDTIKLSGKATGTLLGGSGADKMTDLSSGAATLSGGTGIDVFGFGPGAHATVTDFVAGTDSVQLIGVSAANVHTSLSGADTLIDLGGGASVRLVGVALTQSQINIHFG